LGVASHLLGLELTGLRRKATWKVIEKLELDDDVTPGQFSVGYKVRSNQGQEAFLKASDCDLLTDNDADFTGRMMAGLLRFDAEKKILDHCNGNNMDRVVTAIDYGNDLLPHDGIKEPLFFIIFELAHGDIRERVVGNAHPDLVWAISAMHHLATAISQLHSGKVCHNDVKPANFLYYTSNDQKLADLGCATWEAAAAINDERYDIGDPAHAPPEILYANTAKTKKELCAVDARKAADLYQLGSLCLYLLTGRALTPAVSERLAHEHLPHSDGGGWSGTFEDILPYWREAFGRAIDDIIAPRIQVETSERKGRALRELADIIKQLGEPDPALRGHPANRSGQQDRRSVSRYITKFDALRPLIVSVH
jgi:serine/threonine protein kinase